MTSKSTKKKKLLIIDDDETIMNVLKIWFEDDGFDVHTLSHVNDLTTLDIPDKPDVILLDYLMPGFNGDVIARYLKHQEKSKHIPIIIIAAGSQFKKSALSSGADQFVSKPFDMHELSRTVNQFFH